jgi:hypothetical protein
MAAFRDRILNTDWLSLVSTAINSSLDSAVDVLHNGIYSIFNLSFPYRIVRCRSCDPPWFTPSFRLLMNQRDRAYSKKKYLSTFDLKSKLYLCQNLSVKISLSPAQAKTTQRRPGIQSNHCVD